MHWKRTCKGQMDKQAVVARDIYVLLLIVSLLFSKDWLMLLKVSEHFIF